MRDAFTKEQRCGACIVCIRKGKGDLEKVLLALRISAKGMTAFMTSIVMRALLSLIGE